MKLKSESEVAQSCLTLSDGMDGISPGSFINGFSRQEYWSRVLLPSLISILNDFNSILSVVNLLILHSMDAKMIQSWISRSNRIVIII